MFDENSFEQQSFSATSWLFGIIATGGRVTKIVATVIMKRVISAMRLG